MSLLKKCNSQGYNVTISCTDVLDCVITELGNIAASQSSQLSNFCDAATQCIDDQLHALALGESNDLDYFGAAITKVLQSTTGYSESGELFFKTVDGVLTWTSSSPDSFFLEAGTGITITGAGTSINPAIVNSDITQYTDELAQDAIGAMLLDTVTVNLTYTDATPSLKADVLVGVVDNAQTSLVVWTGTTFKQRTVASLNIPTASTFENGLYEDTGVVKLGGPLTENTIIGTPEGEDNSFTVWATGIDFESLSTILAAAATSITLASTTLIFQGNVSNDNTKTRVLVVDTFGQVYWRDVSTVTGTFTTELAQDAVGASLTDTATVNLSYNDAGNEITADIFDNSITDAKLRNSTAYSIMGKFNTGTGDPADIVAGTDSVLRRTGSGDLAFGTLSTAHIGDDQVTFAKTQNINAQRVLGRSTVGSGDIESLTLGNGLKITTGVLDTYGRTLIGVSAFSSSDTWNKPTGCNAALVLTVGGGGGGAGANVTSGGEAVAGSGGGAGSYQWHYITTGLSTTETVTIGAGGAGGDSGNAYTGQSGSTSSFGSFSGAGGGVGGSTMTSGATAEITNGGAAGTQGSFPTYLLYGGTGTDGGYGIRLNGSVAVGGKGGASILGGGGNEYSYGSGGDGEGRASSGTDDGSNGTSGFVLVYELS